MAQRLSGRNPLSYLGVEAITPPNMNVSPTSPTPSDALNVSVGDMWINRNTQEFYVLTSLANGRATWTQVEGSAANQFDTDSGTAIPVGGVITLHGGVGINTSGAGSTVTINLDVPVSIANGGTNATSFTNTDGVIYFDGTQLSSTAVGTAGEILTSQGAGMPPIFAASTASTTFDADTGSATPSAGIININGDSAAITTSASGNTVVVHFTPFIRDVSTTPYTVVGIDFFLAVDSSAGPITVNMPNTTTTGRVFVVKDWKGQANINNIIITTPGGVALFDGFTAYTMNAQYQSVNLIFDGTNYQLW
jgi:hypothetical protein